MAGRSRAVLWEWALLGLGVSLFLLLLYAVGPTKILDTFRVLGGLTPVIALPYFGSYLVDSLGWLWVLRRCFLSEAAGPAPGPARLFALRAAGEAINAITPTAYMGGEPVKAWLLARHGVPLPAGLASVLVSKTALMLTQGVFVLLGILIGAQRWWPDLPLAVLAGIGAGLIVLTYLVLVGVQRHSLFTALLGLSRRLSGRRALLATWESAVAALDEKLHWFYDERLRDFLVCCSFHFAGWMVGTLEVYIALWLLGQPVDFATAIAIESLSGVAKLAALIVPASLGVQEGGQLLVFYAFGLDAPLAMSFSLLRRARELVWVAFGLGVLIQAQATGWMRKREPDGGEE